MRVVTGDREHGRILHLSNRLRWIAESMTSRYIRQISQQEDLLVVLNADHLGTFSIEGFDVAWRSGGEEGTPAGDCRRCRG
jgi:TolB-like protein